jgi:hypothetical protein
LKNKSATEFVLPNNLLQVKPCLLKDKQAYKVSGKLFLVYNHHFERICVRLSSIDQQAFEKYNATAIHAVPNKYGLNYGWTLVYFNQINKDVLTEIINTAYCYTANQKLIEKTFGDLNYSSSHISIDDLERKQKKLSQ